MKRKIIILRGIPGSGKSTFIKNNYSHLNPIICSADHFFIQPNGKYVFDRQLLGKAHGQCKHNFVEAIHNNSPLIIIDNTNTTLKEMKFYVDTVNEIAKDKYSIEFVRMIASVELCSKRNVHGVPQEAVSAMNTRFQDIPSEWGSELIVDNNESTNERNNNSVIAVIGSCC